MLRTSWLTSILQRFSIRSVPRRRRNVGKSISVAVGRVEALESRRLLSSVPVGPETLVNTTTSNQDSTNATGQAGAVAMDASGNYVVVWESATTPDASNTDIYGQRYNASGVAQGTPFQINTYTTGKQQFATVAMDTAGDFVVTWTDYGSQDGSLAGVYAQRYNAAGVAQGDEFRVNTATEGNQAYSSVAMDASGDFVVTWTAYNQDEPNSFGVFAQRYDSTGATVGGEFQVNSTTTGTQGYSTVAMDAGGDFVISWISNQGGTGYDIYAQRFNAAGTAQGTEFLVNTFTAGDQKLPTVAMDAAGDFVVTWSSQGQDGSGWGVYAQQYDALGAAVGGEIAVNTYTSSDQQQSAVAMDAVGDFVVTWQSNGQDGSLYGIFGRGFTAAGVPLGTELQVNTTVTDSQVWSSVAADPAGDFAVVWTSVGQNAGANAVYSQLVRSDAIPVISGVETTTQMYVPNSPPVSVTSSLSLSDADNANLVGATIQIGTGFQSGQDVLHFTDTPYITGNYNPGSGTLTLTGNDTVSNYEAALRSVTYSSPSADTSARTISFQVNDGIAPSNVQSRTIDSVPQVASLAPATASPTSGTTADFTVTFSEPVTGVTPDDFVLVRSGVAVSGPIAVTGGGTTWTVSLSGISGNGTVGVNLVNNGSIQDAGLNPIATGITGGLLTVNQVGGPVQLSGTTLTINGTSDVDVITVSENATTLTIVVDGATFLYTPSQVTSIVIHGNDSNDTIQVNSLLTGTSLLAFGDNGDDTLKVAATVTQGVTLVGGEGNDVVLGGGGNDSLSGGNGNDWLNGGNGSDDLSGGAGNDVYAFSETSTNQTDTVWEYAGATEGTADLLNFSAMTTAVTVNLTSDTALATMAHRIVKVGEAGQSANFENVSGGSANDFITGNAANNSLYGNGGNDTLIGGDGSDYLEGDQGNDLLKGGNQDDILAGGAGNDYLKGETGSDVLDGGDGFNTLAGGTGDDNYLFYTATVNQIDTVVEQSGEGTDTLNFAALTTAVTGNLTSDASLATMAYRIVQSGGVGQAANFENITGGSGNDQLTGNDGDNILRGNGGDDTLTGGNGNDILIGGDGNDTLKGIAGRNILIGGTGADLLLGGTGDDLMLSGSYIHEGDSTVMQVLMSEWASATPYQMRVDHLSGVSTGGLNTGLTLNSTTVVNDNGADYLTGNAGQDWFLANSAQDVVTDQAVDEVFTNIDTWGV
jgi:Ca2+-binding RTX toxin-like protein